MQVSAGTGAGISTSTPDQWTTETKVEPHIGATETTLREQRDSFLTPPPCREDQKTLSIMTKLPLFLTTILVVLTISSVHAMVRSPAEALFERFIAQYGRAYRSPAERQHRFEIFSRNIQHAAEMQRRHANRSSRTEFGVTKFMDFSKEEFRRHYLSEKIKFLQLEARRVTKERMLSELGKPTVMQLPKWFDWRDSGAVTEVKDQGKCGSCWSFATTGNIEGLWFRQNGTLVSLSEQHLVDCDHGCEPDDPLLCNRGCNGGLMSNAFRFIINNGGIATAESYKYKGRARRCKKPTKFKIGAKISDWITLPKNETLVAQYLISNGPVAAGLNAEGLAFYIEGIYNPTDCRPEELNHAILIVGFGVLDGQKMWIVKNSWGSDWGMGGYFWLARDSGMCGIDTLASSAIL